MLTSSLIVLYSCQLHTLESYWKVAFFPCARPHRVRKSQKTTSWEFQNWPKIDENWKEKARKARKLGEKSSFWKARFFTLFLVGLCTHFLLKKKYSGRVRRHARESGKGKGWDNPRPQEHPSRNRVGSGCELFTLRASRRGQMRARGLEASRRGQVISAREQLTETWKY